ncbi:MAG TPA: hypothetical protein VNR86_07910 [Sphingomicrobium sp.]|nr:hypothetical protein [Sphingomicrobium sp.]
MASFGKRVDGPGGRRRIKRRRVSIQGWASTDEGSRSIIIENLCFGGARVLGHDLPAEGTQVLLRRTDRSIEGRIAWSDGDRRGIVFDGVCRPQGR